MLPLLEQTSPAGTCSRFVVYQLPTEDVLMNGNCEYKTTGRTGQIISEMGSQLLTLFVVLGDASVFHFLIYMKSSVVKLPHTLLFPTLHNIV